MKVFGIKLWKRRSYLHWNAISSHLNPNRKVISQKYIMKKSLLMIALFSALASSLWANPSDSVNNGGPAGRIFFNGDVYRTFVPTALEPGTGIDVIYAFGGDVHKDQLNVAATAPGQTDYHGGRWTVKLVSWVMTHDENGILLDLPLLDSAEDVLYAYNNGMLSMAQGPEVLCPVIPLAQN